MNGIHDMGGMQGMGPIQIEENEPVYHAEWEGRVDAMFQALRGKVAGSNTRAFRERVPPREYLRMSYYELWYTGLVEYLIAARLVTRTEVESGRLAEPKPASFRPYSASEAVALMASTQAARRNVSLAPRFQVGQRVRARNINPVGHTRVPRYARGRLGNVAQFRGIFPIPDDGAGGKPQNLYSIRFPARELWGEQSSPQDAVYIDMWDDYLESA
jgi:nitrile hydratase subunit beta